MNGLIQLVVKHDKRYKTVSLKAVEDRRLSWKAKGLHLYLISRPPEWMIQKNDLEHRATDGRTSLSSALKELQQYSYLKIINERGDHGYFAGSQWIVTEDPDSLPIE